MCKAWDAGLMMPQIWVHTLEAAAFPVLQALVEEAMNFLFLSRLFGVSKYVTYNRIFLIII
jgi:hypothetical protein